MGSVDLEGNLQRAVIQAAAAVPSIEQLVRLSVFNASLGSLGINQRAHWNIDFAAQVSGIPYTTIRPAIWSASLLLPRCASHGHGPAWPTPGVSH